MQNTVGMRIEHRVRFDVLIIRQTNHRFFTWRHFNLMLTGGFWLIKAAHLYHLRVGVYLIGIDDFVCNWLSDKTLIL